MRVIERESFAETEKEGRKQIDSDHKWRERVCAIHSTEREKGSKAQTD
jgi:hypothetical protein